MLMIVFMHNIVCCTLLTNGYFDGHAVVLETISVICFCGRIVLLVFDKYGHKISTIALYKWMKVSKSIGMKQAVPLHYTLLSFKSC